MSFTGMEYHTRRDLINLDPMSSDEEFSALTDLPLFLGYIFSYLLQGILVVQIFLYFIAFPKDSRWIKVTVGFLFFTECLSTFFATYAALWSIVENGDLFDLPNLWGFRALGPLCGIASLTVHVFYSWRIWQVGGHWCIPLLVILLSATQCFMVIWAGTQSFLEIGTGPIKQASFVIVWLAGSALCDIIIAVSLVILLPKAARKLGTVQSKSRVEKLMKVIVETGMVTAFGALFELMFFFMFRNTLIHFILFYMLPKVYANCMLAALNARISSRALRAHDFEQWGSQVSTIEAHRFSNIQIGDGVFHIVNHDGKLVPLFEDANKLADCLDEQEKTEMEDMSAPNQGGLHQEGRAPIATTLNSFPYSSMNFNLPRPLPAPETSSDLSYRDSRIRSLPIPPIVVSSPDT